MTTKRFIKLQIIFVLMLTIVIVGNTFGWAARPAVTGGGFMNSAANEFKAIELVTPDYYVNGDQCTAVTYVGTFNEETGMVEYSDTTINNYSGTMKKDAVFYFKTVITNPVGATTPTNVSLFINGINHNSLSNALYLGVTSPLAYESSIKEVRTEGDNKYFEMLPIVTHLEVGAAAVSVEWNIFYDADTTAENEATFRITDIILSNN